MADSVIGALRIVLGADTAAFNKGLKGADTSLASFVKKAVIAGAAIATALVGAATGLGIAVGRTLDQIDDLGKTAQKIGVPIEELSKLKHAADLSGVSMESLAVSVGKLSKNMVEAQANGTGPIAQAFKALGISVTDANGKLKSSTDIMTEVAGRFAGMEDGAGKTALAMTIFGKSGKDLIPLLNAGAEGLRQMTEEAEALGLVIDQKTFKAAEAFNDNLTRLGNVWDGIIIQITAALAGPLQELTDKLVELAKNQEFAANTAEALKVVIEDIGGAAESLSRNIDNLVVSYKGLVAIWSIVQAGIAPTPQNAQAAIVAIQAFIDKIEELNEVVRSSADVSVGTTFQATADLLIQSAAPVVTSQQQLAAEAREATAAFRDQQATAQEGIGLYLETRTAQEAYGEQLIRNQMLLDAGAISAETFARANLDAAEQAGATWEQAGASIAGSLATIAGSFGDSNSAIATAAKAFGIVQAIISTYTGMAKALELPFPANIAAVAAVAAQGFAFVASIRLQQIPHFAEGGSFKVGGAGGPDSKLVQFAASPGEMVDVRKPGQDGGRPLTIINSPTYNAGIGPADRAWLDSRNEENKREILLLVDARMASRLAERSDSLFE